MIERAVTIIPNILPTLIDLTAEPTIEGVGATNSRNQALSPGDQAPDLLNQSRDQQLTVDLTGGLVLGDDSTFASDTGTWDTTEDGTLSITSNVLRFAATVADGKAAFISGLLTADIFYLVTFKITSRAAGAVKAVLGGISGTDRSAVDTFIQIIKSGSSNTALRIEAVGGTELSVDDVTLIPLGFAIHSELDAAPASAPDYVVLDKHTFFSAAPALITGNNSTMDTIGNWTNHGAGTVTGGYDSGDPGHAKTLRIESDGTDDGAKLSGQFTLVNGLAHVLAFDYKHINIDSILSENENHIRIAGGATVNLNPFVLSLDVWSEFEQVFIATAAHTELNIRSTASSGSAANELLLDNVKLKPLFAISHYRHNADLITAATQQPFLNVLGGDLGGTLVRQSITAPGGLIVDSGGNSLDLTINGPKYVYDSTLERYVLRFNGVDGYLVKSNDANLNFGASTDFALEVIISGFVDTSVLRTLIEKGSRSGTDKRYLLAITTEGLPIVEIDDSSTSVFTTATTTVNDGAAYHIITTHDRDGNQIIYVNGSAEDTDSISSVGDIDDTAEPLTIGIRSQDESSNPFPGNIALVRIWNRVPSAAEVLTLYNDGSPLDFTIPTADQWGSQTILYLSDFSAGVDGWGSTRGAAAGNIDGISGVNDTLRFTIDGSVGDHSLRKLPIGTTGLTYNLTFDYYIPSGNTDLDGILAGGGIGDETNETVLDTWTTVHQSNILASAEELAFFALKAGATSFTGNSTDVFYVKNVKLQKSGAVAEWIIPDSAKEIRPTVDDVLVAKIGDTDTNKFLFALITGEGHVAGSDPKLGHYIVGKSVSIAKIAKGSFTEGPAFPGIRSKRSFGGIDIASKDYGEKQSYGWTYTGLTDSERAELQAAYRLCVGALHPLGLLIDEDGSTRYLSVKWTGYSEKRIGSRWQIPVKFVEHPR